jgi:hypothetical protein
MSRGRSSANDGVCNAVFDDNMVIFYSHLPLGKHFEIVDNHRLPKKQKVWIYKKNQKGRTVLQEVKKMILTP